MGREWMVSMCVTLLDSPHDALSSRCAFCRRRWGITTGTWRGSCHLGLELFGIIDPALLDRLLLLSKPFQSQVTPAEETYLDAPLVLLRVLLEQLGSLDIRRTALSTVGGHSYAKTHLAGFGSLNRL